MALIPLLILAPVLLAVAWSDLRHMRIPNTLSIIALVLFVLSAIVLPPPDIVVRVVVAAVVFAIGFAGFSLGLWGGGDVKILAALLLFIPVTTLQLFCYVFSASMLAGICVILGLRRIPAVEGLGWKSVSGSTKFPMGISIATAGLLHPLAVVLLGLPLPG